MNASRREFWERAHSERVPSTPKRSTMSIFHESGFSGRQHGWYLREMGRLRSGRSRLKRRSFRPVLLHLEPRWLMANFSITTTADTGIGSLRQEILDSNAAIPGPNTIDFDVPVTDPGYDSATGVWTISVLSALPSISVPVTIDGTSQTTSYSTPVIDLDGTSAGIGTNGLALAAGSGGSQILGLMIENFNNAGIDVTSAGNTIGGGAANPANLISGNTQDGVLLTGSGATGNLVVGNFIGTAMTGKTAVANATGVEIASGASGNTIGGTTSGARNVISGNTSYGVETDTSAAGNVIEGDYVGTDGTGNAPLANTVGLWIFTSSNTIGGTATGAGNVIAANTGVSYDGGTVSQVLINASDNLVQGNLVGLGADGLALPGPIGTGIVINQTFGATIGGTTAAARNVVSGNVYGIGLIGASANLIEGNYVGTDPTGTVGIGNTNGFGTGNGIALESSPDNTIGGTATGAGNVISDNVIGIQFVNATSTSNLVEGNLIGTDKTGTVALGNDTGIDDDTGGNTIGGLTSTPGTGPGNIIAGNTHGITVSDFGSHSQTTTIIGNLIGAVTLAGGGTSPANQYGIIVESFSTTGNTDAQIGGTSASRERHLRQYDRRYRDRQRHGRRRPGEPDRHRPDRDGR